MSTKERNLDIKGILDFSHDYKLSRMRQYIIRKHILIACKRTKNPISYRFAFIENKSYFYIQNVFIWDL